MTVDANWQMVKTTEDVDDGTWMGKAYYCKDKRFCSSSKINQYEDSAKISRLNDVSYIGAI